MSRWELVDEKFLHQMQMCPWLAVQKQCREWWQRSPSDFKTKHKKEKKVFGRRECSPIGNFHWKWGWTMPPARHVQIPLFPPQCLFLWWELEMAFHCCLSDRESRGRGSLPQCSGWWKHLKRRGSPEKPGDSPLCSPHWSSAACSPWYLARWKKVKWRGVRPGWPPGPSM